MSSPNKVKITDIVVKGASLPDAKSEVIIWDTEVTGFGLRIRGMSKSYIVSYRPSGAGRAANMKKVKIGGPDTIKTAAEARKIAFAMLGKVAAGGDPARDRAESRRSEKARISDLLDVYELDLKRRKYVATDMVMSLLRRRLAAHLSKDVREMKGSDFAAIIKRLEREGQNGAADAFRSRCRTFLGWCVFEQKVLDSNPLAGYQKGRGTRQEKLAKEQHGRALSDAELLKVWKAADPEKVFGRYIRFLILTGCRRSEGAGLLRKMVNKTASTIDLPPTFTKQARGHTVYVHSSLSDVLAACKIDARSDLVFPSSRTGGKMSGWNKMVAKLVEASGVSFTLHDLRRTFRTGLSRLGVDKDTAELALGHAREDLEAVYNRDDAEDQLRDAFSLWAKHVEAIIAKDAEKHGAFA